MNLSTYIKPFLLTTLIFQFFNFEVSAIKPGEEDSINLIESNGLTVLHKNYKSVLYSLDYILPSFLEKWEMTGVSVAVAKEGKLIYAKGFGYADKERGIPVMPDNLFRIASVSKLFTAVSIMQLVEKGKLSLNDYVFGKNGILNDPQFLKTCDARVKKITIRQLLTHTAGWSDKGGDPLFMQLRVAKTMHVKPPADLDVIIKYMLKRKLRYNPGSRYHYSNFSYAVLGRIIEKLSGLSYDDYVFKNILHPLGIYDMKIGQSSYALKDPEEVNYYEPENARKVKSYDGSGTFVSKCYGGNNIEALGAAGGWIASAPDLLKFIVSIDGHSEQYGILKDESIRQMTDTAYNNWRPLGWIKVLKDGTWIRTGTLAGSTALVVRKPDGLDWVVLFNSTSRHRFSVHKDMYKLLSDLFEGFDYYNGQDLFGYQKLVPIPNIKTFRIETSETEDFHLTSLLYGAHVYPCY
jgi:CubicO group peptidase (beta-lactamase class C family)